jgi:16S rRNA (guanine527-N7)-methyltransferase
VTKADSGRSEPGFRDRLDERIKTADLPITLTPSCFDQFVQYFQLLRKWNRRINLTALPIETFPSPMIDRLFVEPLAAAEFIVNSPAVWLDLGSGGGSPALPLKIVRPAMSLTMVESRSKKAAFLREAVNLLRLEQAEIQEARIEDLPERLGSPIADLITMRAVKVDASIADAMRRLLRPGGRLLLFGSETFDGSFQSDSSVTMDGLQRAAESPFSGFRSVRGRELPGGGGRLSVLEKL